MRGRATRSVGSPSFVCAAAGRIRGFAWADATKNRRCASKPLLLKMHETKGNMLKRNLSFKGLRKCIYIFMAFNSYRSSGQYFPKSEGYRERDATLSSRFPNWSAQSKLYKCKIHVKHMELSTIVSRSRF